MADFNYCIPSFLLPGSSRCVCVLVFQWTNLSREPFRTLNLGLGESKDGNGVCGKERKKSWGWLCYLEVLFLCFNLFSRLFSLGWMFEWSWNDYLKLYNPSFYPQKDFHQKMYLFFWVRWDIVRPQSNLWDELLCHRTNFHLGLIRERERQEVAFSQPVVWVHFGFLRVRRVVENVQNQHFTSYKGDISNVFVTLRSYLEIK